MVDLGRVSASGSPTAAKSGLTTAAKNARQNMILIHWSLTNHLTEAF